VLRECETVQVHSRVPLPSLKTACFKKPCADNYLSGRRPAPFILPCLALLLALPCSSPCLAPRLVFFPAALPYRDRPICRCQNAVPKVRLGVSKLGDVEPVAHLNAPLRVEVDTH
jgi:hypothetical protein